jgi:uncharacterized protein involved in cysteine biosynthesis
MTQANDALALWASSWTFLFKHRLYWFAIYPLLVAVFLGMGMGVLTFQLLKHVMSFFPMFSSADIALPSNDEGLWNMLRQIFESTGHVILTLVLIIFSIFFASRIMKFLTFILILPFMVVLSDRVHTLLNAHSTVKSQRSLMSNLVRTLVLFGRNFLIETIIQLSVWVLTLALTSMVPLLAIPMCMLSLAASAVVSFYFSGFNFMDYAMERRGWSWRESIRFVRQQPFGSVALGAAFAIVDQLPLIGFSLSSAVCVIAAERMVHQRTTSTL